MKSRSYTYRLPLGRRHSLQLIGRRFRVSSARRSTRQRQLVINVAIFGLRQIVLRHKLQRPIGRPKKSATPALLTPVRWLTASLPLLLIGLGTISTIFWSGQLLTAKTLQPARVFAAPTAQPTTVPKTLAASTPVHLSIPSVNIDADIVAVGLNADGAINLPAPTSWQVGWYSGSPTPGQLGPAIIAGHVDSTVNISVFWRLRYVQAGDQVLIRRSDGTTATFVITGLEQYDQTSFPTTTVYGNLDYAGLKLITCGGTFDKQTGHYTENTVVSAQLKS